MAAEEIATLHKIEKYVLATIVVFAILFLLACLKNRFAKKWIKLLSWALYTLVPILISYNLGLMGDYGDSLSRGSKQFSVRYHIWSGLLLYAFSSFDNLIAFSLEETKERSKLFYQFLVKLALLLLSVNKFPLKEGGKTLFIAPLFLIMAIKFLERFGALSFAAGATPPIKEKLSQIIKYTYFEDHKDEEEVEEDPVSMKRFKYLVGPNYSTIKEGKIVDGITVDKIWECKGRLLSSGDSDGQLKDSCLSFALFWLILGKLRGYPLYETGSSKMKALKLVFDGLVSGRVEQERAFRVIEVELNFLQDYFYSKYVNYYFMGFGMKFLSFIFSVMFLNLAWSLVGTEIVNSSNPTAVPKATMAMILILLALEVVQISMVIASRCFRVTLLCYYAKREMSNKKNRLVDWCFEKVIGAICQISLCVLGRNSILFKPWKRELDQYSLLETCTCFGVEKKSALQGLDIFLGIPLPKPGRKAGSSVVLSQHVKKAVIVSLHTSGFKLSNGVASLRQNGVHGELSWACNDKHSEVILVWHIATSICEMHPDSQGRLNVTRSLDDFKVATNLSKYCAYLLAFAPSLISIPLVEADAICDTAIEEARGLLKKPSCSCWTTNGEVNKYEKLKELLRDEEEEEGGEARASVLYRGVRLGEELMSVVEDEGRRWKILSEFWAEMILFSAQSTSNSNEMVHAEKLADGGEFITHLWALLFHAGIVNRGQENLRL